jgi:predicted Zn-dependent protease
MMQSFPRFLKVHLSGLSTLSVYGGRRGGASLSPRLVIALLMIGGAIVMHFLGTTKYENDYTGRVQRLAMSSTEEEIAMGLKSAPQLLRQMGGQHPDKQAQALVTAVGQKLIEGTAVRQSGYPFRFYLLADDKTVNAFALPGGQIFITSGLFRLLKSEDQLAGVLGHEIGHVVGRHSNEQMAQRGLWVGIARGVGTLLSDGNGQSMGGMQVADLLAQVKLKSYGRDDEIESDRLAVRFMHEVGYDPAALIGVMEILAQAGGGGGPEFLSSHPNPDNRIGRIREELEKLGYAERR